MKVIVYAAAPVRKVVANEDTLLLMMFLGWANERDTKHMFCVHAAQTGKHLLRTQNVSDKNRKHFFVSRPQILSPQQMLHARANGETFVSATLCPRLPPPVEWTEHVIT